MLKNIGKSYFVSLSLVALAVACVLISLTTKDPDFLVETNRRTVDGLTIFAVFFVSATVIERLLEPLSSIILPKKEEADKAGEAQVIAKSALIACESPQAGSAQIEEAEKKVKAAGEAKANLAEKEWKRTIVMWLLASVIGMYVSASLEIYLLRTVGIGHASRWEEILATGLIIGSGTKPLHDVITIISEKKKSAQGST